jgi:ferredoxin
VLGYNLRFNRPPRRFAQIAMPMIQKLDIDQPSCIGCGTCWVSNPELFREDRPNGELKAAATGGLIDDEARLRIIAEGCPTLSIHLVADSGEILFPTAEQIRARDHAADW